MKRRILRAMLLCGAVLGMGSGPALAASDFTQGTFTETDPAGPSYRDLGICSFITGPRTDLAAGQFLLTMGDAHSPDTAELQLTGTYTAVDTDSDGDQAFTLSPDTAAAAQYFEGVLRTQLADNTAVFQLDHLSAKVRQAPRRDLLCHVSLTGSVSGLGRPSTTVSVSFRGQGQYFPGDTAPSSGANVAASASSGAGATAGPSCPTTDLAPLGLAPVPDKCTPSSCLVNFKSYRWWTSFQYYGKAGGYFPKGGFFFNGSLKTAFAPKNVFVDARGLHLMIARQDLGGGPVPAGAEVALMFNSDGSEANLGYGDYLVTVEVISATSWSKLDPNAALGMFTYERFGNGTRGPTTNPNREIDLAELSRWGWDKTGTCPNKGKAAPLCEGNAQFTLQLYEGDPQNLHRYTIKDGVKTVTLVMKWHGANTPVTFEQYDGAFTFAKLPARADHSFTSSTAQNQFIPATACERFHINFWNGNYSANKTPNPPPSLPQEAVVTNFEFRRFP